MKRTPRSRPVAILLSLAMLAVACGGGSKEAVTPAAPSVQHKEVNVGGVTRSYRVFAPPSLDRSHSAPLVLVLGGFGNTAESMVTATEFDRQAIDGGFVVAYPDGLDQTWNAGYCCGKSASDGVDDEAFLLALIDQATTEYNADPAKVYVVGVSNGGMMAYRMGCDLAPRIAGVGSVAGAMVLDDCHPSRPVPVVEVHGTADPLVPYGGGTTAGGATQPSPSTHDLMARWTDLDGCSAEPAVQTQGPVTTSTWTGCAGGSAVKLIAIDGGGHTWYAPGLGPANGAVDATHEMWSFFSSLRPGS